MLKGSFYFFVLVLTAGASAVAQDGIDIATIDKNLRMHMEKTVLPEVIEKYEYYEVRGRDEKEIRRQMRQNGTKWDDGKTYDAVTSWNWKWDYDYVRGPEGCSPDSFSAKVHVTFRYPKWVRSENSPEPLVTKWDGYMKNLILHENGHRDMAVDAASEFARAVAGMSPAATCEDLDRQINALGRERMAKLNAASVAYDAATTHGATQGAVFP